LVSPNEARCTLVFKLGGCCLSQLRFPDEPAQRRIAVTPNEA